MTNRLSIAVIVVFTMVLGVTCLAIENPSVGSPRSSATSPPTSTRSGLHRSPNPIDRTSSLVVTGNVGGGKHFRGIVPYNAVSDFGGRLGSDTLDSFLRYSTGANYASRPTPFYSQTRTVTRMPPGLRSVVEPPTASITGSRNVYALPAWPEVSPLPRSDIAYADSTLQNFRYRPLSATPLELERSLSSEVEKFMQQSKSRAQERSEKMELFQRELEKADEGTDDLRQKLIIESKPVQSATEYDLKSYQLKPLEQPKPQEPATEEKTTDVYEQMAEQIEQLKEIMEQAKSEESRQAKETKESKTKDGEKEADETEESEEEARIRELYETGEAVVRTKVILGKHKSFASFAEDRFNQHLKAGEEYLKQGKYYRAADVYTLASIYKPQDPLPYAGKSHALFAAGEYMSSALFLSRALEIFPEYAFFKVDLVEMVGDRDKLETRIVDIEQWQRKSNSGELQFLLAYIYYQMDRPDSAKIAIDGAYEKMPDSKAVIAMKAAIDTARNR